MKIAIVNGSLPHYDHGLSRVVSVVAKTLAELGLEIDEINLNYIQIPYFDGLRAHVMDDFIMRIKASAGVVIASTVQMSAPSAIMQTFLEFFECNEYRDAFYEKHCLLSLVSKTGGERSALEYLARTIYFLGGFESGRIGLQEGHAKSITGEPDAVPGSVRDIIEKEAEDFYRAIRQNRRYIVSTDVAPMNISTYAPPQTYQAADPLPQTHAPNYQAQGYPTQNYPDAEYPLTDYHTQHHQVRGYPVQNPPEAAYPLTDHPPAPPYPRTDHPASAYPLTDRPAPEHPETNHTITAATHNAPNPKTNDTAASPASKHNNLNLDAFTERQEQDIQELTALFSQKYTHQPDVTRSEPPQYQAQQQPQNQPASKYPPQNFAQTQFKVPAGYYQQTQQSPQLKTVKQLTQNLPHYYQPQMSAGLTAVIQFSISGDETFEGYLTIIDNECDYTDGHAENPEITIISDSNVWHDVLKGKHTAQKAFMIGGLKVRGNFVLLTKFDALFKLMTPHSPKS